MTTTSTTTAFGYFNAPTQEIADYMLLCAMGRGAGVTPPPGFKEWNAARVRRIKRARRTR